MKLSPLSVNYIKFVPSNAQTPNFYEIKILTIDKTEDILIENKVVSLKLSYDITKSAQ